jgi:hypothetical protein
MPPLPPVTSPACVKVEFKTNTTAAELAGSRFFLSYAGGPPDSADLNTLATVVSNGWNTNIAPSVNSAESLVSVVITDLSSATGAIGEDLTVHDGTHGGTQLPASACMVMNHHILRRYRGGRPRTYLRVGNDGDIVDADQWSSGILTSVLDAWEAWIAEIIATTGIGVTDLAIANISYKEGNLVFTTPSGRARNIPQPRPGGPLVDAIQSTTPAAKIGSQRRRLDF